MASVGSLAVEFCDRPIILERAIEPLTAAAGLLAVGEHDLEHDCLHCGLETIGSVVTLAATGATVAGSSEVSGLIEIVDGR